MKNSKQNPPAAHPTFTHEELVIINNALNEVCHGVPFSDGEFQTRIGHPRAKAESVLEKVAKALGRHA